MRHKKLAAAAVLVAACLVGFTEKGGQENYEPNP